MWLPALLSGRRVPAIDGDPSLSPLWVDSSLRGWLSLILRLTAERSAAHAAPLTARPGCSQRK